MKYSITGFSQEKVIAIAKTVKDKQGREKTYRLDATDLLILQEMADFMNRKKIIKHIIDDEEYFSIRYDAILEDLPILDMQKRALRDRVEKICLLGILERRVIKDSTGSWAVFRLTEKYEELIYDREKLDEGVGRKLPTGGKKTTDGGGKKTTDQNTNILYPNPFTKTKEDICTEHPTTASRYEKFIKWMETEAPYCYKNMTLPTEKQFNKLLDDYGNKDVIDIIQEIENRKDKRKNYSNLNLTIRSWMRYREKAK